MITLSKGAESLLAQIPAFGDSIGNKVSKAQLGTARNKLNMALDKL